MSPDPFPFWVGSGLLVSLARSFNEYHYVQTANVSGIAPQHNTRELLDCPEHEEISGLPKDSSDFDLQPEVIFEPVPSPVSEKARKINNRYVH